MFLDFECRVKRSSTKGASGVKNHQIGGGAGGKPPAREAEAAGGIERNGAEQLRQGEIARVIEAQGGRQEGFQRDSTRGGLFKGQAFGFFVLRRVHRGNDIDQAGSDGSDHGDAIIFGSERGFDLEEGAVVGDVEFIEGEVVDRGAGGDVEAVGLGAFKRGEGARGGDLIGVIAGAVISISAMSRSSAMRSAMGGDGRETSERGEFAGSGGGTIREGGFLHVGDDQRAKGARVGEGASIDLGVAHHMVAIGEGDGACIHQQADLGHLVALAPPW